MAEKELTIKVGANISDFEKKMARVAGKMKDLGNKMQSLGKTMSTYITLPVIAAGGAAIKFATDYEESLNKVDVAFKSSSKQVQEFAKASLKSFGIAEGTALDMAALFGDMATSMGLNTKEAADMSTALVGLAGDLASFKNIGIGQATTALNAIFTGETESLKMLGIVMTEANLEAYALSQGIRTNIKDMTQAEKVQLRYSYVMQQTTNAQGDFARTGGGAANQTRIFQESLKQLAQQFGAVILPLFTKIITKVNELVAKFSSLSEGTKNIIIVVAGLAAAVGPLLVSLGMVIKFILPAIIAGLVALKAVILPVIIALAALTLGFSLLKKEKDLAVEATKRINKEVTTEVTSMNMLFNAIKNTKEGTKERNELIKVANDRYKDYLPNLLTEKNTLEEIEKAQRAATRALIASIAVKATEKEINDLNAKSYEKYKELFEEFSEQFTEKYGADRAAEFVTGLINGIENAVKRNSTVTRAIGRNLYVDMFGGKEIVATDPFSFKQQMQKIQNESKGFVDNFEKYITFEKNQRNILKKLMAFKTAYQEILADIEGKPTDPKKILPQEIEFKNIKPIKLKLFEIDKPKIPQFIDEISKGFYQLNILSEQFGENIELRIITVLDKMGNKIAHTRQVLVDWGKELSYLATDVIVSFAESIGNAFNGGTFADGLNSFLVLIADWAKQFGSLLIAAGVASMAFQKSLAANPAIAIGAGIALVAAGAAVKGALESRPTGTGQGSSYGGSGSQSGGTVEGLRDFKGFEIIVTGELVGKGSTLAAVLDSETTRRNY